MSLQARIAPAPGRPEAPAAPSLQAADPASGLRQLLRIEAEFRRAETGDALGLALVNETGKLTRARQSFLLARARGTLVVERVSGLGAFERDAPLVRWIAGVATGAGEAARSLDLAAEPGDEARTYPFPHALWIPMRDRAGAPIGGLLLARERPWDEADTALAARLAETGAHALLALRGPARRRLAPWSRKAFLIGGACALAALAIPVPMTVLAPAGITAERPFVLAAPIDGIIEEIAVAPNAAVREGDLVARYVDTAQRNALAIAERDVQVAEARLRQVTQGAYLDDKARREMGQARAELALKSAERDFARDTYAKTQVRAEKAGVVVYADRKDWFGKPVAAGTRILEIADPGTVEVRIDLPVADAVALPEGTRVRVFLDSDPLGALDATMVQASPVARLTDAGVLAYRVTAALAPQGGPPPRLGAHGTAQLFGQRVPLAFYLLRRPLTYLRQKVGL
ncbi:HlyD family efflux transporter periplasmic adaptor subunit [Methylobacterium durans]|uniref:efflux RND transporter periplasmic adaptor subunit n=1 Tax=Methylobacterium durans TaxID=2202825 RepID=UPI002AFEE313|nr:HlyD family efflux transporter periplasmic adaptor subunit [Methylobacterium durans]MEA1834544.1 HlyD family efflux transporter periplasmic adaptor subunit [Methylobacterium durans]